MVTLNPFYTIRPAAEHAPKLASVPYDVVSRDEAASLAKDNPISFLRIIRSDIEAAPGASLSERNQLASDNLQRFLSDGVLIRDEKPQMFVYRIALDGHQQTGLVALSSVDDYEAGRVMVHEKTRPVKVEDRTEHMIALGAQCGPVLLTFREEASITTALSGATSCTPLYDITTDDGIQHTYWTVPEPEVFTELFKSVAATYIADGHHRAESAALCRKRMQTENTDHNGTEAYNNFLTVLFPDNELRILAYNRVLKTLPAGGLDELRERLSASAGLLPDASPSPRERGCVSLYADGAWQTYRLPKTLTEAADPVQRLDAQILQDTVLAPIFGVKDPRTDDGIDFVGGIRGTAWLEKLVDEGSASCAFSLYPVSTKELLDVADSGKTMPPKSTWFEPKLRSGLATHEFKGKHYE